MYIEKRLQIAKSRGISRNLVINKKHRTETAWADGSSSFVSVGMAKDPLAVFDQADAYLSKLGAFGGVFPFR